MFLNVPLQDLYRHNASIGAELQIAFQNVLQSGRFVLGSEVSAFEEEFGFFLNAPHCVANANGTDALELALRAVEVKAGDEVIMAANAGMYASVATLAIGAIPVYAEIDARRRSLDPRAVQAALTKGTKAVVLTHLYGCSGYVAEISAVCAKAGLALIEDCAEAHGARVSGRAVGTWGAIGCFSFYPTKNLGALGDGGACVTNDFALAERLRALRQYGWSHRYHATIVGGRNSRLDEIQAAILRKKLPLVAGWNARRRQIAQCYNTAFADLPLDLPEIFGEAYVGHLYVVGISLRDAFRSGLKAMNIGTDVHFPVPDYRQPAIAERLSRTWSLQETEASSERVVTLPCFPEMTDGEVDYVIAGVRAVVGKLFG